MRIYDILLKLIIIRFLFVSTGLCHIFSAIHVRKFSHKPSEYIRHFIVQYKKEKYIVAIGINSIQKKKVKNAVRWEREIADVYKDFFKFNQAIKQGRFFGVNYAIYHYYDNTIAFCDDKDFEYALKAAQHAYKNAPYYEITENNVNDFIIQNMHIIRPDVTTQELVSLKLFNELRTQILKVGYIKCCSQHGDYNLPNMLKRKKDLYLVDLERTMPNMIASYDWYHLLKCKNGWYNHDITPEMKLVPYFHIIKLITDIDVYMDKQRDRIKKVI